MSLLCEIFGHKTPQSYSKYSGMGGGQYLRASGPKIDGVNRAHFRVYGKCPRCGQEYEVGMIHGHQITDKMLNGGRS